MIALHDVFDVACEVCNINKILLLSPKRDRDLVDIRMAIAKIYFDINANQTPTMRYRALGNYFNRSRCTMIHSVKKANTLLNSDKEFSKIYWKIKEMINPALDYTYINRSKFLAAMKDNTTLEDETINKIFNEL